MPHLFVDISAHGLGHLAQVGPVLNALAQRLPQLELSVRSALPASRLSARIAPAFRHIPAASDFGFHMLDALRLDHPANVRAYRDFHADWPQRVERDAALLAGLRADFVFTDVAYLPLAAAASLGLPAAAMSSLNWADLFAHFYGDADWAAKVLAEMRAAYASASFLAPEPALPMDWIPGLIRCRPIAAYGARRPVELRERLGIPPAAKVVVVALGGFPGRLPVESWLGRDDIVWLLPADWRLEHRQCRSFEALGWLFTDLLASVDAVVSKPGYGSFVEAACNGTPTAYVRREDWPEQEPLIDWLQRVSRAAELTPAILATERVADVLDRLWSQPAPPPPEPAGAAEVADWLAARLTA